MKRRSLKTVIELVLILGSLRGRREMGQSQSRQYKDYRWIVSNPDFLGGKLVIRGTRFSVSFILSCMAEGMSATEIEETYGPFPHEAVAEILRLASEVLDARNVAA